jgi:hypothetical protein
MDHEPADPLNDRALEREIESLLAVDPSPEFLARVRARLATEPVPSSWGWGFGFAVAGAAAVVLIAVLIAPWMRSTPTDLPRQATVTDDVTLEPAPPQPTAGVRVRQDAGRIAGGARRVRIQTDAVRGSDVSPFGEVLISADEVRAYEFVVGITRQQRLPAAPAEESVDGALPPVTIEPLTIEPLPQIARLETGERP